MVLLQTIEDSEAKSQYYMYLPWYSKHVGRPDNMHARARGVIFRIYPCSSRARQADQTNGLFETAYCNSRYCSK
jgi:hypothetical protein